MMKRLLSWGFALAVLCLCAPFAARAQGRGEIVLDTDAVAAGMERSWAQGYEPAVQGDALVLLLPLAAPEETGPVTATLVMADGAVTPFRDQDMTASAARDGQGVWPVRFRLRLLSDYKSGDYPCTVRLEGGGRSGEIPLLLRIRGGGQPEGDGRPELSGVAAELRVGRECALSFTIANPWPDRALTGVTVSVTDPTGEILPADTDMLAAPDLAPGRSAALSVPLSVLPGAGVTVHALRFDVGCTVLGQQRAFTQTFYLPVREETRLEQGGLQAAASVLQGDTASMSLPLMNLGRTELRNVCATLVLPGLADRQSVLVGAIPAGESRAARLNCLVPKTAAPGDYAGTISVTAEDAWGNPAALELPVALSVEERPAPEEDGAAPESAAGADWRLVWSLAGLSAALLVGLLAQGAILRGKLRALEESRL